MVQTDIKDLLIGIAKDDRRSFDTFYDLFYQRVFRFCYCFLQNREACKEVVSDVFFSVWKSKARLSEVSNIETYLYVVSKNASLNYLRKQSVNTYVPIEDIPISIESDSENPENALVLEEIQQNLISVVNTLPKKNRLIFLMVRQDGLGYKDVAEILGLTESTVRVQMKIAIDKILTKMRVIYPHLGIIAFLCFLFQKN